MPSYLARTGRHPDLEALVMDVAAYIEVDGQPIGPAATGTRVPADYDGVFVHVERGIGSGGLDRYGITDVAMIGVATRAESRAVSRQMTEQLRLRLRALADTHVWRGVLVDRCVESSAPGPAPSPDVDSRFVESAWILAAREHRGPDVELPD